MFFYDRHLWLELSREYSINTYLSWLYLWTLAIVLLFTWKVFPWSQNKRVSSTLMILFLNLIGLWLWLPSKKEIEKMATNQKDKE